MDLFKLLKEISYLTINHEKELLEFVLFMKLFVVTKMKIAKNTLELIMKHWIRPRLHKIIRGRLLIPFTFWKLMTPTKQ